MADTTTRSADAAMIRVLMGQLGGISTEMRAYVDDLAESHGLSMQMATLLWQIDPEAPVPMRYAAEKLCCDPSNVTFIADRLEERGLLERRPSPTDRRIKLLALTDKGTELRAEIIAQAAADSPFVDLSGEEQKQLCGLLTKVSAAADRIGLRRRTA